MSSAQLASQQFEWTAATQLRDLASRLESFLVAQVDRLQRASLQLQRDEALLEEAWQRLEADERWLLAERELLRQGLSRAAAVSLSGAAPSDRRQQGAGPGMFQLSDRAARQAADLRADPQDQAAWSQFQQLRREIQRFGRSDM